MSTSTTHDNRKRMQEIYYHFPGGRSPPPNSHPLPSSSQKTDRDVHSPLPVDHRSTVFPTRHKASLGLPSPCKGARHSCRFSIRSAIAPKNPERNESPRTEAPQAPTASKPRTKGARTFLFARGASKPSNQHPPPQTHKNLHSSHADCPSLQSSHQALCGTSDQRLHRDGLNMLPDRPNFGGLLGLQHALSVSPHTVPSPRCRAPQRALRRCAPSGESQFACWPRRSSNRNSARQSLSGGDRNRAQRQANLATGTEERRSDFGTLERSHHHRRSVEGEDRMVQAKLL